MHCGSKVIGPKTKQGSNPDLPIESFHFIVLTARHKLWFEKNQTKFKCYVTSFTVADDETRRNNNRRHMFIQETNKLMTEFFSNTRRQYNKIAARHREERRQLLNSNRKENK